MKIFASKLRRSVADFEKIVKGFGMLPNKIFQKSARLIFEKCTSGYRRALLANSNGEFASSECKWRVWQHRLCLLSAKIAECTCTCCACYSPFPIIASAISLNGNRRQPPPCLPKSENLFCKKCYFTVLRALPFPAGGFHSTMFPPDGFSSQRLSAAGCFLLLQFSAAECFPLLQFSAAGLPRVSFWCIIRNNLEFRKILTLLSAIYQMCRKAPAFRREERRL